MSPRVRIAESRPGAVLGLWSGTGIVIANMIGAGVFLSAGFMAQDLRPGEILLAWVAGAILAICGARAYAAVAQRIPRSGGEYRYLSDLLHPALGYFAGVASLLVGFSAPVAIDAIAAGAFLRTIVPQTSPMVVAVIAIVVLTLIHAAGLKLSVSAQNALVAVKLLLIIAFVTMGVLWGSRQWPSWEPPNRSGDGFPLTPFAESLFFIAFAFSGWNAAAYVAEEFRDRRHQPGRAMMIGCAIVAVLYLMINWILVANVSPNDAKVVFTYEQSRVTLGHLVAEKIVGPTGGMVMSGLAFLVFLSAMSAMILAGPRVYAAMADDGLLPRIFGSAGDRPPAGSVILQGAMALLIVFTHRLRDVLGNIGAILTLFAALTCLSLLLDSVHERADRPSPVALLCATIYIAFTGWMLYIGFRNSPRLLLWIGVTGFVAAFAWWVSPGRRRPVPGAG